MRTLKSWHWWYGTTSPTGESPDLSGLALFTPKLLLIRHHHAIDYVYYAVAGCDIGLDYLSLVDHHTTFGSDREIASFHGFCRTGFDIGCHDFSSDHMVSKHFRKLGFVG
jgi:hypothetical protein